MARGNPSEEAKPTYKVVVEKAGANWYISVPDVPGALASVRRSEYIESIARSAIARKLGLSEDSFSVEINASES